MTDTPGYWREGPTSWRTAPRPVGWKKLRAAVLQRDAHACQLCGNDANEVDHIGAADNHDPANLRSLCSPCHRRVTSARASLARRPAPAPPASILD